ncbi:Na+/H+ antiporter subunit E [Lysobacter sp. GX 14042]|uniref:Na+/H+ antiporter subunit E n=1 Tax=Lysobacter sp. GX 14042 TaxID=2907155 RepID=UPI001F1DF40B|nr:Na+/H+ antiporter subunit E [Lysobacter sp. GX 14042]MCE7032985.1 Na+/H+ antiporter subunit E [Lysobacter sp. GX 14042]
MKRWMPSPLLFVLIVVFWLLLVSEFSLQQLLMGMVLAVAIPPFAARLDREFARIGSVRPIPRLVVVLLWDILLCNIEVARQVLGRETNIHPGFIWYPLDIQNIHAIAALTSFITLTPGTVSAALSDNRRYLLIHVFNLQDAEAQIAEIKRRYEVPLMEIFP